MVGAPGCSPVSTPFNPPLIKAFDKFDSSLEINLSCKLNLRDELGLDKIRAVGHLGRCNSW